MKFSEQWLREWVNPNVSTEELVSTLTMAGLEVDAVEPACGEFSGVVVGEIASFEKHPDADKLNLCQIDVGESEKLSIICGAPNVRQGMKVAVAKIGAVLPENFKIKKAKLRGVESFGMLCSAKELGISEEGSGIMDLDPQLPLGQDIREALNLDDSIIDVDLTPNRGDCLSIRGIAREVGVLTQSDVTSVSVDTVSTSGDELFDIQIENAEYCPKYLGRIIRNIDSNASTPDWMVRRLERSGTRPIHPVVDVTNYVMLEMGQPMHAFDLKQLSNKIVVRNAAEQEAITLLDGQEIKLSSDTLVIADDSKPLAIAGVMGGQSSGVEDDTTDILLECAYFEKVLVAGKARKYGLHTDSSHRYERGVDFELQEIAMERATQLITEICGGDVQPINKQVSEQHLPKRNSITFRHERLNQLVGFDYEAATVSDILNRLDMTTEQNGSGWTVQAPSFRFDIEIEEDLIEEVVRIHGYDNIPVKAPIAPLKMNLQPEASNDINQLKSVLVSLGYQEAITYSFVSPEWQKAFYGENSLDLLNPISSDLSSMRQGLMVGLAQAAKYNLNRQQSRVRLFETGLRFVKDTNGDLTQDQMIAGLATGTVAPEQWGQAARSVDFFDLKGDLECLIQSASIDGELEFVAGEHQALHTGQTANIVKDGNIVGHIGTIHPQLAKTFSLPEKMVMFEMKLDAILSKRIASFTELSKFPTIKRDLALVMDESVSAGSLMCAIKENSGELLQHIDLFDVYTGEGVQKGQKSIAISLTYGDQYRNLKDEEVHKAVENLLTNLNNNYSISIRE